MTGARTSLSLVVSSELKRRMKADKKADDKAQKASTAPAQQQAVAQPNAENDDQELDPNVRPRPCVAVEEESRATCLTRNTTRCACSTFNR